jgi:hypothetical protein
MQKQTTKIREYGTVTKREIRGMGSGERRDSGASGQH